ncbi:RidA family protein [Kineococcus sp. NUM-3379]
MRNPRTPRRTLSVTAAVAALALAAAGGAVAADRLGAPAPGTVEPNLPVGSTRPLIANGVAIGSDVAVYKSSGLGPSALNTAATAGTPESYVDPAQFPGGALPAGVTITEAQGINVLRQIGANLASVGLSYDDVITMRVFLDNAPGTARADFAGWNRAYRQFFANTDLETGEVLDVPLGTAAPTAPLVENAVRPSRFALEVASLPVDGWLVEVEVDAVFPEPAKKPGKK